MTPTEAAQLLDLPVTATPEQIEARFNELRARLEDRIAKAPTPGLKAKYRETLDEITTAFETLAIAADSSSLPVLKKEAGGGRPETGKTSDGGAAALPRDTDSGFPATAWAGRPVPGGEHTATGRSQVPGLPPPKKAKSGREFALVAVIAVTVLAAGGWFVMKTRAENAEKARLAAEAKAEAERVAEEKRLAAEAEQVRLAEARRLVEEEKVRQAAAEKAEQQRRDKLAGTVRVGLAEAELEWQDAERQLREAERRLADLRGELRALRETDGPTYRRIVAQIDANDRHVRWFSDFLAGHPARRLRVRTEQLLAARQIDEAAGEFAALVEEIKGIHPRLDAAEEGREASLYGTLEVRMDGSVSSWAVQDFFGQRFEGTGSRTVEGVAAGEATVIMRNGRWADQIAQVSVRPQQRVEAVLAMPGSSLAISGSVAGAAAWQNGRLLGPLPLRLTDLPPGPFQLEIRADGYLAKTENVKLEPGRSAEVNVVLQPRIPTEQEIIQKFTEAMAGIWIRRGQGLPGTGLLLISAGSREVVSKGKFFGASHMIDLRLAVPDPRNGEIHLINPAVGSVQGRPLVISQDGDQLVMAGDATYRLVRGRQSDW